MARTVTPIALLTFGAFLVVAALLFAALEVQIEGERGWAAGLPTWRIENRLTRLLWSARPLTGYHLFAFGFIALLAHASFAFFPSTWSARSEARVLSFLTLFWVLEDFLWFIVNPAFGIGRFRREHIWWHAATWWWIMPRDYWLFTPAGLILYWWSVR